MSPGIEEGTGVKRPLRRYICSTPSRVQTPSLSLCLSATPRKTSYARIPEKQSFIEVRVRMSISWVSPPRPPSKPLSLNNKIFLRDEYNKHVPRSRRSLSSVIQVGAAQFTGFDRYSLETTNDCNTNENK